MALTSLAQIVRDRFGDITEWRSFGVSWKQIYELLSIHGECESPAKLKGAYYNELARRKSPKRLAALSWIEERYSAIKDLRNRGYDWPAVVGRLTADAEAAPSIRTLVAEFNTMDAARSLNEVSLALTLPSTTAFAAPLHSPDSVDQLAESRPASPEPTSPSLDPASGSSLSLTAAHPAGRPRTMREQARSAAPKNSDNTGLCSEVREPADSLSESATADQSDSIKTTNRSPDLCKAQKQSAPVRPLPTSLPDEPQSRRPRSRALQKMLDRKRQEDEERAAEKAEKENLDAEKLAYQTNDDPYVNGADLRVKIERVSQEIIALVREASHSSPDEKKTIQTRIDALNVERDQLIADFRTRHCHSKANRAILATLSNAALASGAFRTADGQEVVDVLGFKRSAIKLLGYDRPSQIEGVADIPDPLFVIEDFSEEDLSHLNEAYEADRSEIPTFDHSAATPRRRLAEAALLRGSYVWRLKGWCAYDDYIRLSGEDHPSPHLCVNDAEVFALADWFLDAIDRDQTPFVAIAPKLTGSEPDWNRLQPWERDRLKAATGGWLDIDKGFGS